MSICSLRTRKLCLALLLLWCSGVHGQGETVDDVLQHAPMASVFAMRAFDAEGRPWEQIAATALGSYAAATLTTYCLKRTVNELRPDKSDHRSFPSGHATYAFAGAAMLHHEYGSRSPWISIGGFGLATLIAADRVRQDRHYLHDVCAGAVIGVASTELSYLVSKKLFRSQNIGLSFTGQSVQLAMRW